MSIKEKCEFFSPQNALIAKVGGPLKLDPKLLTKAEAQVAELKLSYGDWIEADLDKLTTALDRLKDRSESAAEHLAVIEATAHEIKGQAGTFDYPLFTLIAESLNDMLRGADTIEDRQIELVEAHIDAIGVIVRGRIQGDGGKTGRLLLSGLQTAARTGQYGN